MNSLQNLSQKQSDIRAQVKALAQENVGPALKEAFNDLKTLIPNLTAIRWSQYTPHFNDGDTCEFGLHGVYFNLGNAEGGDYGDGFEYISSYGDFDKTTGLNADGLTKVQNDALVAFESNLSNLEEMLKIAFDDHAQVTLTATEIEVEEYEHD